MLTNYITGQPSVGIALKKYRSFLPRLIPVRWQLQSKHFQNLLNLLSLGKLLTPLALWW